MLHEEQPATFLMTSQCHRRHAANTNYCTVGPVPTYKNKLALIQSTVDQMWFRISTNICSALRELFTKPRYGPSMTTTFLIIRICRANLVLRVIWQCDICGITPHPRRHAFYHLPHLDEWALKGLTPHATPVSYTHLTLPTILRV